jgi:phosphoribosylformimino-5-aminoimidazole carboxamide ribotide isomerase
VMGVIAGRAIYTGDLDLAKAQKYADGKKWLNHSSLNK